MIEIAKPVHFYQQFASSTHDWMGTDSKELFEKNCAIPSQRSRLEHLNWTDSSITYHFNSEGFRDEEFDSRPAGIALGCSHTQGIGVDLPHCWPVQLGQLLNQKIWNLGIGGAALDTCYRILEYWIQHLDVKFVTCLVPDISRYELYYENNWNNITSFMTIPTWLEPYQKNWIVCEENGQLNQRKNLLAMQQICNCHGVPLFYITNPFDTWTSPGDGRDLMHYGPVFQKYLANKMHELIKGKI
jgi:hypothetical protein